MQIQYLLCVTVVQELQFAPFANFFAMLARITLS